MALVQQFPALNPVAAPVCSICIANYNGVEILTDCIDSILAQQGNFAVEIIIHDDASTDDSVAWIKQHYPNVELLAASENAGFCVANNRMVAQARGEFVLLLNNDAALFPDALLALVTAARAPDPPGILTLPQYDWQTGELVDRGCLLDPFYNPVPNLDSSRTDVAMAIGACLFLPRELWNDLGGFPEWMGSIGEDLFLCCHARLRNVSVRVTRSSGYRHRQGASFGGNRVEQGKLKSTFRRRALSERNKTAAMVICTPTWVIWPLLAVHVLFLSVEGVTLTILKRNRRLWREIYAPALRSIFSADLRARRRETQSYRQITWRKWWHGFVWMPRKLSMLRRHGLPTVR